MKNTSVKNVLKSFLAIALFSLGFGKAAAHIDPAHQAKSITSVETGYPCPPTMGH